MIDGFDRARAIAERFRFAFDHAAIAMALVGLDGSYIRVNPAFCRMVGRTEQELQDGSLNDITHPDDVAADNAGMQDLLRGVRQSYETLPLSYLNEVIAPVILGRDVHDREAIWQELFVLNRRFAFFPISVLDPWRRRLIPSLFVVSANRLVRATIP